MNKQIPKHYTMARRGLDLDGIAVDVYATTDDVGYILGAVALTGDDRDILELLRDEHCEQCEKAVEAFAQGAEVEHLEQARAAIYRTQRPTAHRFEREFCIG